VTAAYVAVAFALLEVAQRVFLRFETVEQMGRVALGVAVLGFPIAIVLAFVYDVTPKGIVRTPEDATDDPAYTEGPGYLWAVVVLLATLVGAALRFLRS